MTFSGLPVVQQITDGLVRITGVSLAGGATGTIGLAEGLIPLSGTAADIALPVQFRPRVYDYPLHTPVPLAASVQVNSIAQFVAQDAFVFLSTIKSGTKPSDFLITIANMSGSSASILGASKSFAALASGSVDNISGGTTITGDVGVIAGTITGFPPGTIDGTSHVNDAAAQAAIRDAAIAHAALSALPFTQDLTGQNLGGLTLPPGIYRFNGDAPLDGTLVLDAQNEFNAFWVFQIAGDFIMSDDGLIDLDNDADANTVFWTVGGDASIGLRAQAVGTYIAMTEVVSHATVLPGRTFSLAGNVTLTDSTVTVPNVPSGFFPGNSGPLEIYVRFH